MKRQSCIEEFFNTKSKARASNSSSLHSQVKFKKKRSSMNMEAPTIPAKCSGDCNGSANFGDVVNLCSDDEDIWETKPLPCLDLTQVSTSSEGVSSTNSSQTIIYELPPDTVLEPHIESNTLESTHTSITNHQLQLKIISEDVAAQICPAYDPKSAQSVMLSTPGAVMDKTTPVEYSVPRIVPEYSSTTHSINTNTSLRGLTTPKKTPAKSQSSHSKSLLKSPYFSPAKKRQRTPIKDIRRNLIAEIEDAHLLKCVKNEQFASACMGMDDKTVFLLSILHNYLQDTSIHHFFDVEAHTLLNNCLNVVKPGMRLICRLYWRKEGWLKKDKCGTITSDGKDPLDDPTFDQMLQCLVTKGLLAQGDCDNISLEEYTSMLGKDELTQVCKAINYKSHSKQDAIEALTRFSRTKMNISNFLQGHTSSNSKRVLQLLSAKAGPCYKLADRARDILNRLYRIMFLGIDSSVLREKKLELVLLYDKIQRETYPIDKGMRLDSASVVFRTKDEFERYISAQSLYDEFLVEALPRKCAIVAQAYDLYKEIGTDEMERYKSTPEWLRVYTAGHIYVKIMTAGVQDLKKDKRHLLAVDILTSLLSQDVFRRHKKAEWYAEKALIFHSALSRSDEAAKVLVEAFNSPELNEEAKDTLRPRARKIAAKVHNELLMEYATKDDILENNLRGIHVHKQPMERTSTHGKLKFKTLTAQGTVVLNAEEECILHYISSREFTHGEHWEGRIVTTIFFLLFWDIIYSQPRGVPGVFLSYYQKYPMDLYTESFYTNRKERIDAWLAMIGTASTDKLINIMYETWNTRPANEISGINRSIEWENIRSVSSLLGGSGLRAICYRLAVNYGQTHSGFPDLTLWHETAGRLKFVEVKTDADKPSMKQIQWMLYLRQHDIATEFCYLGVNTTRQRCRTKPKPGSSGKSLPN